MHPACHRKPKLKLPHGILVSSANTPKITNAQVASEVKLAQCFRLARAMGWVSLPVALDAAFPSANPMAQLTNRTMNKQTRSRKFTAKQSARLGAYLAGGLGASTVATSSSNAAIIAWNGAPLTVNPSGDDRCIVWDLSTMTASVSNDLSSQLGIFYAGTNYLYTQNSGSLGWKVTNTDDKATARLSLGTTIGDDVNWVEGGWSYFNRSDWTYSPSHPWATGADNTQGYIGFYFNFDGNSRSYGWASFTYDNVSSLLMLNNFAYEDTPNLPILAGDTGSSAVPEPSTCAMSALVAGGIAFTVWRRRRAAAKLKPQAA
jgi:hypothetical protein